MIEGRDCFQDHTCYEDIPAATVMFDQGNTSDFGHGVASGHFKLWTAEDLGANPNGLESACPISLRTFTSSGFIAIYQPFFSEVLLPDEEGKYYAVTDYRRTEATSHPSP